MKTVWDQRPPVSPGMTPRYMYLKFDLSVDKMLCMLCWLNFCCLLRSIIISGVHGAFAIPLMWIRKTLELKNFLKVEKIEAMFISMSQVLSRFLSCARKKPDEEYD